MCSASLKKNQNKHLFEIKEKIMSQYLLKHNPRQCFSTNYYYYYYYHYHYHYHYHYYYYYYYYYY